MYDSQQYILQYPYKKLILDSSLNRNTGEYNYDINKRGTVYDNKSKSFGQIYLSKDTCVTVYAQSLDDKQEINTVLLSLMRKRKADITEYANYLKLYTKPVHQYTLDGKYLYTHKSIIDACTFNKWDFKFNRHKIYNSCSMNCGITNGYIWCWNTYHPGGKDLTISKNFKNIINPVRCYSLKTGYIKTFRNVLEASYALGRDSRYACSIIKSCMNKTVVVHKLLWRFSNKDELYPLCKEVIDNAEKLILVETQS